MMAISLRVATRACSRSRITACVRLLSRVPISGSARELPKDPLPASRAPTIPAAGGRSLPHEFFETSLVVNTPSLSRSNVVLQVSSAKASGSGISPRRRINKGSLSKKIRVAAPLGEKPSLARNADRLASRSRTAVYLGPRISAAPSFLTDSAKALRKSREFVEEPFHRLHCCGRPARTVSKRSSPPGDLPRNSGAPRQAG